MPYILLPTKLLSVLLPRDTTVRWEGSSVARSVPLEWDDGEGSLDVTSLEEHDQSLINLQSARY